MFIECIIVIIIKMTITHQSRKEKNSLADNMVYFFHKYNVTSGDQQSTKLKLIGTQYMIGGRGKDLY